MQSPEPPSISNPFSSTVADKGLPLDNSPTSINNNNNNNINVKDSLITDLSLHKGTDSNNILYESTTKQNGVDTKREGQMSNKDRFGFDNGNKDGKSSTSEEDEDEPDAMSTDKQDVNKLPTDDGRDKQLNGYSDSGEEDMDEDDRLIIDDEELHHNSMSKPSNMDQVFSCPQCHVVTTSSKAYVYYLDHVHNVKESEKHLRPLASDEDNVSPGSKTLDSSGGFINLSIPLHREQVSSILKQDEYDDEDSSMNTSSFSLNPKGLGSVMPMGITTENIDQIFDDDKKKKKKTRQEVDPGKYFEAVDSSGTKYACSQCGNVYKWRKSLNKHWKEKHLNDSSVEVASPPGMLELLKSGKYTQLGSRRIYDNNFLQTIKAQKDDDFSGTSTPNSEIKSSTPTNFGDNSQVLNVSDNALLTPIRPTLHSKMIGPFVANTVQPVFPEIGLALQHFGLQNGYDSASDDGALDLTPTAKSLKFIPERNADPKASFDQDEPLDLSKKMGLESHDKEGIELSTKASKVDFDQFTSKVHRCFKCDYTSTSDVDFANHTGSHYSKRVCKCFECKIQLNSMEELNAHYIRDHNKKLTEYKEAIKKIPHGLQQTYHLLKMDLQSIGELNNQDLGSSESKSLKCKKCDFEAKWPAELQKHAVSHSEERPYICMVCGSTYKWKWDLVKHFQKSHPALPNPYRRNDKRETPDASSEDDTEDEPDIKRSKLSGGPPDVTGHSPFNRDDGISVEGIFAATQAAQRFVSSQANLLDGEPFEDSLAFMQSYQQAAAAVASVAPVNLAQELVERHTKAQRAIQEAIKNRQNALNADSPSSSRDQSQSSSPGPLSTSKVESLPYKCTMCNYHARWPSEVTQHMKNHSDCKPYLCPRCDYRSKWKWDVVKHLKRCGGGTINDVIDLTKVKKKEKSPTNSVISGGPPNAIVSQQGKVKKTTPQPFSFILPSVDANGQQSALVVRSTSTEPNSSHSHIVLPDGESANEMSSHDNKANKSPCSSEKVDLASVNSNNSDAMADNNINNNYAAYCDGQPILPTNNTSSLANQSSNQQNLVATASSSSPSLPTTSATTMSTTNSSHRQSSSGEIWNCPHCPFSTQSQAELKRHSGLHMDDKPFKCDDCHYSTRWACDLKKHRKSYDHHPKRNNTIPNSKSNDQKVVSGKTLHKAKGTLEENSKKENKGRFKCFECSVFFISLKNLIDHRMNSHNPSERSSPPQTADTIEIDAARIKHPRKQMRQFSCPMCPFICKSRRTMDKHMDEHEQMEKDAFQCFYCDSQYKDKEALLDHIVTHPAFSAKEWETFFMITEEEEQTGFEEKPEQMDTNDCQQNIPTLKNTSATSKEQKSQLDSEAATQARIQQILDEIPKQKMTAQQQQQQQLKPASDCFNKFKCEWCPAEFINLTSVYKHACVAHPIQLKEQDVSMSLAYTSLHGKTLDTPQSNSGNKNESNSHACFSKVRIS